MKCDKKHMLLYAVTDRAWVGEKTLYQQVEAAPRAICAAVDVPIVAIGGINRGNIGSLAGSGVNGVALVSAIFSAPDIEETCRELRKLAEEIVGA